MNNRIRIQNMSAGDEIIICYGNNLLFTSYKSKPKKKFNKSDTV